MQRRAWCNTSKVAQSVSLWQSFPQYGQLKMSYNNNSNLKARGLAPRAFLVEDNSKKEDIWGHD